MKARLISTSRLNSIFSVRVLCVSAVVFVMLGTLSAANADVFIYTALMDGPSESPPNASPGTGMARVDYDNVAHTMRVKASFADLIGTTTMAHIHAPTAAPLTGTAGVATQTPFFSGFPIGVTSGSMDTTFDLTLAGSWNPAYVTANGGTTAGAEAAFATALSQGRSYYNIHTTFAGGGEIRGFLRLIPEPATAGLASTVLATTLLFARKRTRSAR